jgi:hypothetical protein
MEVLWGSPSGCFQSSLRDFSSFEFLPRTASWAKFSRPCGTQLHDGRFSRTHFTPRRDKIFMARLKPCPSFRDAPIRKRRLDGRNEPADVLGCAPSGSANTRRMSHPHQQERSETGRKRGREKIYNRRAGGVDPRVKSVPLASRLLRHLPETVEHGNARHQRGSCSTCSPASHQARERRSPHRTPSTYLRRFPYWPFSLKFFAHPSCVVRALLLLV